MAATNYDAASDYDAVLDYDGVYVPVLPIVITGGGSGRVYPRSERVDTRLSRRDRVRALFERLGRLRAEQESERRRLIRDDEDLLVLLSADEE